jgi:hypothetical protein
MAIQKKQVVVKDLCKMCTSTVCMCSGAHYIVKTEANNVILFLIMSKKGKILLYTCINMIVATTIFYRLPRRSIYFVEGAVGGGGCVPV